MIRKALAALASVAVVWFIPLTAKAIEALIRNVIISVGTARNLNDVNLLLGKAILALSLWLLLVVLFGRQHKSS